MMTRKKIRKRDVDLHEVLDGTGFFLERIKRRRSNAFQRRNEEKRGSRTTTKFPCTLCNAVREYLGSTKYWQSKQKIQKKGTKNVNLEQEMEDIQFIPQPRKSPDSKKTTKLCKQLKVPQP